MFKNILKSALRNIAKNKLFSFISVVGLSLAIGCFTVLFIFVDFWNSMDSFHENVDEIFLVEIVIDHIASNGVFTDSQGCKIEPG
ncbi:MAG: hypothetical protein JSV84_16555 [Gemmatimonadota bacterium]|nr:MAG: hypothetical protein JSV84_16555 [Gemmatimonadota bacterium]